MLGVRENSKNGFFVFDWGAREEQEVWVQALARVIGLCCFARHFALTVPPSTQVYKWVLVNLKGLGHAILGNFVQFC